ncbi:hypothetical protein CVT25_008860 [Psilocybe cyanescens]|uniref:Uncharacterized protein n=1 Tax=Psilocybe cyanescens TaxID=93625 RepID=A0A409XAP2_PSICY|nr:hypothetical protein CVT25_008860 [Psilocybe cyanescens]
MYSVEKRYRVKMARAAAAASATSFAPAVIVEDNGDNVTILPSTLASNKPLASHLKYRCGSGICVAGAQSSNCFGRFPLIKDDDSATAKDDDYDHIFPCFNSALSTAERR